MIVEALEQVPIHFVDNKVLPIDVRTYHKVQYFLWPTHAAFLTASHKSRGQGWHRLRTQKKKKVGAPCTFFLLLFNFILRPVYLVSPKIRIIFPLSLCSFPCPGQSSFLPVTRPRSGRRRAWRNPSAAPSAPGAALRPEAGDLWALRRGLETE